MKTSLYFFKRKAFFADNQVLHFFLRKFVTKPCSIVYSSFDVRAFLGQKSYKRSVQDHLSMTPPVSFENTLQILNLAKIQLMALYRKAPFDEYFDCSVSQNGLKLEVFFRKISYR